MRNLLNKTLGILIENGKSESDVLWVGNKDAYVSWADFAKFAKNLEYDNGFGGAEIAENLLVVGSDWWLERHEYDGSEWWEFKTLPVKPANNAAVDVISDSRFYYEDEMPEKRVIPSERV